ncbi:phosphoribosyltransferase [Marinobacter salicampi]|uniref:phosphoribosyltransferase n=1 Tax=Marinobacter salicampi TaxID=435907 RepID=UPI00140B945E|nr:phosphoribosyltransferase [Marinobacter salicampi]
MDVPIKNRTVAGQALAEELSNYRERDDVLVLALPRGGVPVAAEIAKSLDAGLDLMLVRKLGLPAWEELAMGAIASGGVKVLNDDVISSHGVSDADIEKVAEKEGKELKRRETTYRGDRSAPKIEGRCVILVDDGVATGATMEAAIDAVRKQNPGEVVLAVTVAPQETLDRLGKKVDHIACLATPEPFMAIGKWYRDFGQTSDDEVRKLLDEAWKREEG